MISIALICLLCIGAVSAAEDVAADDLAAVDGEDIGSIDEDMSENDDLSLEAADASGDESGDVLAEEETKTFTQLKEEIANPVDGVVTLSGTYKYDETADAALRNQGIVIRSNITINGPATIDGSNLSRIFYLYQSSATLNGLTFINGKGQKYGGAVLAYGLSPTIKNCIFKDNLVTDDEEQYDAFGGAIYFWSTAGATVSNCTFEDNVADLGIMGAGGAIYDYGDGLTIKDSTFTHNQAFTGGALESYGTNMNINKCLFDSNQAITGSDPYYNGEGGAVLLNYVQDDDYNPVESNHKITQSVFINNQAGNRASALKNEAIGTTIKDCIFLGPNTLEGNSIFSGCDSGTECENIWMGHTTDNQSEYVSGGPDTWLVLDLNDEAKEGYYDVIASLNHLYTRSTGEVTDVESGISCVFNVAATAGTCAETVNIENGVGTFKYKLYEPEEGNVSVNYNGVTKSLKLQGLEKPPLNVDISVDGGNIVVNVTDEEGNPVDGAEVSITLDGVETSYTTSNGIVNIPAASGGHNMSITTENGKTIIVKVVAGESAADKIGTNISVSHTSISTYNKTIDSKNDAYVLVTLKDANGNVLANKTFKFILNGKVYEYVTDGNGQKKINILSAAKKTLSAVVLISGDEKYAESIQAVNIKINPQKVKLVAKKKTFKANKKVKKFKATLTNSKGKALKGKKIVFIINKKKYTAKTNKKGVATVKVKLSKKKTYKVSIKFAGDNTYKKASKKSRIVIK